MKKKIAIVIILLFALLIFTPLLLITHEFNNIDNNSTLKYLVDKEIRGLPIIKDGVNVSYKSHPVDGTSKGFNSVKISVSNRDAAYKQAVDYFISLGYIQENRINLQKGENKITIEQIGGTIEITKYSWD